VFITLTIPLHFKLFFVNVSIIFVIIDPKLKKIIMKRKEKNQSEIGTIIKIEFFIV